MDIQIDRERIVNKFKRNGHFLSKSSLQLVSQHLKSTNNPHKRLDDIIKKINEMVIMEQQQFNDNNLKLAIQLLNHKTQTGKTFNSYQKFLSHIKQWTIYTISPYQSKQRCKYKFIVVFVDKPDPSLFKFQPEDYTSLNLERFRSIRDHNIQKYKNSQEYIFMGVLYEKFVGEKSKIMLQNQINQIQLIFTSNFHHQLFLIPGCTYIVSGEFKNKDIQLTVNKISYPEPLTSNKANLFDDKLKLVCDSISQSKDGLDFSIEDFKTYDFIYNKIENKGKPILIFGNVSLNLFQAAKIEKIVKQYTKYNNQPECIILMIAGGEHDPIDLKKAISDTLPIFIVPHINSEGPRILPKPPILRHFYNAKILTNPAKLSIEGKQCIFLNYPLVKNLFSKSVIPIQSPSTKAEQLAKKVSQLLYSQNNVAITNKIFWKQSPYFNIHSQNIVFISDSSCNQVHHDTGKGGFASVGNFQRQGEFICFMPHKKQCIQLSDNKQ